MKNKTADLHIHTRFSDGTYRVAEVFRIAKKFRLSAVSITDHDSTGSFEEAAELSRNFGIEIVPGVELSCDHGESDIHILGYFINTSDPALHGHLEKFREGRSDRARKMTELLQADGINVGFDEVMRISHGGNIARPHIAQLLIEKGYAYSMQDAFYKFIGTETKYYVPKFKIGPEDAVRLIHESGGLAFAAHPYYLKDDPAMLDMLIECGIDGLETVHSSYDEETSAFLDKLAAERGLLRSGGSDCHGRRKTGKKLMGEYTVPYAYIEAMKNRLGGIRR